MKKVYSLGMGASFTLNVNFLLAFWGLEKLPGFGQISPAWDIAFLAGFVTFFVTFFIFFFLFELEESKAEKKERESH
jgi:hypothetical protein